MTKIRQISEIRVKGQIIALTARIVSRRGGSSCLHQATNESSQAGGQYM